MIDVQSLTKRYGPTVAVDALSFEVTPGQVTGFLGPNGAGKSTTMRVILGLDAPTAGAVTVNGVVYTQHRFPLQQVGALLDAIERAIPPDGAALLAMASRASATRSERARPG